MTYAQLTDDQRQQLIAQGCSASDWRGITISSACDPARIVRVQFIGTVRIGDTHGSQVVDGTEVPCGLYDASVADCEIGDRVRIARIGSVISNYRNHVNKNYNVAANGTKVFIGKANSFTATATWNCEPCVRATCW